jgi:hypothetical protein
MPQPLWALEPPEVIEGPDPVRGDVKIVEEDVPPLDCGLHPGDEEDSPLPGIGSQVLAEGEGVVVRDAEDLEAFPGGPVDEAPAVLGDEPLPLPGVEMQIRLQDHRPLSS